MDCNIQQYICCVAPSVDCWVSSYSLLTVCTVYPPSIDQRTFRIDTIVALSPLQSKFKYHNSLLLHIYNQSLLSINDCWFVILRTCTPRPPYIIYWFPMATCICSHTLIVVYAISQWLIVISAASTSFISSNTSVDCCVLYYCNPSSRHLSCHHIPLLHICWLLICYFDTCILITNPYSIHTNYLFQ